MFKYPASLAYLNVEDVNDTTAKSGPKRKLDEGLAEDSDLVQWGRLLERLPYPLLVRVLLNDGEPIVNVDDWIDSSYASKKQREDAKLAVRRALQDDVYWSQFVTTCFPGITKLADSVPTWRLYARRIIELLAYMTVTPESELIQHDWISDRIFAVPFVRDWPAMKKRVESSLTCSQVFGGKIKFETEVGRNRVVARNEMWTIAPELSLVFASERFMMENENDGTGMTVSTEYGTEGSTDEYTLEAEYEDWEIKETVHRTIDILSVKVWLELEPQVFIDDELFELLDEYMEKGSWRPRIEPSIDTLFDAFDLKPFKKV